MRWLFRPTNQQGFFLPCWNFFFGEAHASSKFGLESRPGEIGPGSCLGLPPCHSKSTKQTTLYGRSGSGADPHDVDPQSLENCDRNIQLGTQKPWKTYQLSEIVVISSCSLVVWNGTGHFTGASKGRGPLGDPRPLVAPVSTTSFKIWIGSTWLNHEQCLGETLPLGPKGCWYVSAVYPMWHIPAWVHCVTTSPFWVSCFMTDFGWNHFFPWNTLW